MKLTNLAKRVSSKQTLMTATRSFASGFEKFNFEDALNLNGKLTDEEQMIQESARNYCTESLLPRVKDAYNKESFDRQIMNEMGEMGFLGCSIPEYGLPGVSSTAYGKFLSLFITLFCVGLINREVERIDSGYRSALSVQSSLVMYPIYTFGNQAVKDKWIPKLATAEAIGCFGLTEPEAGSNPSSMATKAVDKGSHYVLNGSKTWITNSPLADVFVIWAQDEQGDIRGFVVERDFGGVSTPKIEGKLSLRASTTGMIFLDNVEVPKENILNVKGLRGPFSCLN